MKKWLAVFVVPFVMGCAADDTAVELYGECTAELDCDVGQVCGEYICSDTSAGCWLSWGCIDEEECSRSMVCHKDPAACAVGECGDVVMVPAGTFSMGCDGEEPACHPLSRPAHDVTFAKVYYIDKTEVSVFDYASCVAEGVFDADGNVTYGCDRPELSGGDCNWNGRDELPVTCISWYQAKRFCEWNGKDLCTEAQWEYAARGLESLEFPWQGDADCEAKSTCEQTNVVAVTLTSDSVGCGDTLLSAVMPEDGLSCDTSEFGALYMAGNAWEWVQDFLHDGYADIFSNNKYEDAPTDGSEWLFGTGGRRVCRGGRPDASNQTDLHLHRRYGAYPPEFHDTLGFRCCAKFECDVDGDCDGDKVCLKKANGIGYCADAPTP